MVGTRRSSTALASQVQIPPLGHNLKLSKRSPVAKSSGSKAETAAVIRQQSLGALSNVNCSSCSHCRKDIEDVLVLLPSLRMLWRGREELAAKVVDGNGITIKDAKIQSLRPQQPHSRSLDTPRGLCNRNPELALDIIGLRRAGLSAFKFVVYDSGESERFGFNSRRKKSAPFWSQANSEGLGNAHIFKPALTLLKNYAHCNSNFFSHLSLAT